MSSHSVNVTSIAPQTNEEHLRDFFTFCGKITSIDFQNTEPKSATIHFEKPSAAKTALMLNGGTLDGAHLTVTSDTVHQDEEGDELHPDGHIEQEAKPRAGIVAEYLARGYTLSDSILEKAITMDSEKGISTRFLSYFNSLDKSLGAKALGPDKTISAKVQETLVAAQAQAKSVDEQKGISKSASDYYTQALTSPWGQKVREFYTTTTKQVLDIHEEARRIADERKTTSTTTTTTTTTKEFAPAATTQEAPTVV